MPAAVLSIVTLALALSACTTEGAYRSAKNMECQQYGKSAVECAHTAATAELPRK